MSTSDLLQECQALLKEINAKEENLKDVASYHFANIRSKIKIQQEYLKNNCNTIALNLINQVNEFESIWLDKLALIKPEHKIEYECTDSLNKTKHILEEKLKVFNSIEFDIEKYTFEGKNATLSTNDLGSLNFNTYIPLIATAFDSTIKILNVNSGKCLRTLTGHKSYISSIKKISTTQLATSSWDNTIKIWDIKTGECVRNLNEHKSWIECIKIQNGMLITGSGDTTVKFWNLETGVCTKTLVGHSDYISCMKVLQIKRLLTGSGDNTIKMWCIESGELINTFRGHKNWITCLKVISNDRFISGSWENRNSLKIWNSETYECLKTMDFHSWITCIKIDKKIFATASNDASIKIVDINSLDCITTLLGHLKAVKCLKFYQDNKLISGSCDGSIKLWCITNSTCIFTFYGHIEPITCIKFWSEFHFLSASENGAIKIFNLSLNTCTKTLVQPNSEIIRNKCLLYLLNKND